MSVTPKQDSSPRGMPLMRYATTETRRVGFTEASLSRQDRCHTSCDSKMAASFDVTWINCSEESPVPLWGTGDQGADRGYAAAATTGRCRIVRRAQFITIKSTQCVLGLASSGSAAQLFAYPCTSDRASSNVTFQEASGPSRIVGSGL